MKQQIIVLIELFILGLTMVALSGSCINSADKKTETAAQETGTANTPESAAAEQPEPAPATETAVKLTPEKQTTAEKPASRQTAPPPRTSTTDKAASAGVEKTPVTEPPKPAEQPQSQPVAATKPEVKKEENTVPTSPPKPQPEPAVSKPMEPVTPPEPIEQDQSTAPTPGDWAVQAKYVNMKNPVNTDSESLSIGKSLYNKHCASCHGKSGRGDGSKAAQLDTPCGNFRTAAFQKQTDGALFYKIREGRDDMPSYKKKIPYPEDIWHIVNYIRTLQ